MECFNLNSGGIRNKLQALKENGVLGEELCSWMYF
jgi:hypothetical protein